MKRTDRDRSAAGRKVFVCAAAAVLAAVLVFLSPVGAQLRSMIVMKAYSAWCYRTSLAEERGFEIRIPGGKVSAGTEWYPLMLFYDAGDEYAYRSGTDTRLNVYYAFPRFDIWKGRSLLYDTESPYYGGFYGAYVVSGEADGFVEAGDSDGTERYVPVPEEIVDVVRFDLFELVLDDFGLTEKDRVFSYEVTGLEEDVTVAGYEGGFRLDAGLTVNGTNHTRVKDCQSYLQYGKAPVESAEPFAPVRMYGRVYGIRLPEKDISIFFYILARDPDVLETTDRELLSKAEIRISSR
jgi:hypothetical protein